MALLVTEQGGGRGTTLVTEKGGGWGDGGMKICFSRVSYSQCPIKAVVKGPSHLHSMWD